MVKFTEKQTCKFVTLCADHECLWNPRHPFNRNIRMKNVACEAIARKMNLQDFSATEAKKKFRNLKATYNAEKTKTKKFAESGMKYLTKIKWISIMDSFLEKRNYHQEPGDNLSSENAEHAPETLFPGDSQWDQSVRVSSDTSLPSESEIEQCIKSISDPEVITITPEIETVLSTSNSEVYTEIQSVQPVSHTQVSLSVTPEILSVKSVSSRDGNPVTSTTAIAKSVANPEIEHGVKLVSSPVVTAAPSQTIQSVTTPKFFTLIPDNSSKSDSTTKYIMVTPEIQSGKSVSNPEFLVVTSGSNHNAKNVAGSRVNTSASDMLQRKKQVSSYATIAPRKRPCEEVSSTNPNNEINKTISMSDDLNDQCEDEMVAFGHFVALNLKKMTMQSALSAQTEILSVLTRHRLNDSTGNQPSKQIYQYILSNGIATNQNPDGIQKVFFTK